MRVLGIDPGLTGAWAVVNGDDLEAIQDMPVWKPGKREMIDPRVLSDQLRMAEFGKIIIEKAQPMPKQGVSSTFRYGRCMGIIEAVAYHFEVPVHFISPVQWKRKARLIKQDKDMSRALARTLWPKFDERFRKVKDHGKAEAALIAYFGVQCLNSC